MVRFYKLQYGLTAKIKVETESGALDLKVLGYLIDVKNDSLKYLLQEADDAEKIPVHNFQSYLAGLVTPCKLYYKEHAIYLMSLAEEDREIERVLSIEDDGGPYLAAHCLDNSEDWDRHAVLQYSPFFLHRDCSER